MMNKPNSCGKMKKLIVGLMVVMMCACEERENMNMGSHVRRVVVHDTVYIDSFVVVKYFLMAGGVGDYKSFFEKDIKVKERTWMYLRVEFPKELTWAVDPLLQYVLNYELESKNPDEPMIIIKPAEIPS